MGKRLCDHGGCFHEGTHGLGWGLHGLVQWYCPEHFVPALARLAGLLERAFGRAREAVA